MKEDDIIKTNPPTGKPIISSRLPKAFSQPKHLTNKKMQEHHDLSAANEFKKVKKLLSPLKDSSPKANAFRRVIKKLACFPQVSEKQASIYNLDLLMQSSIKLEEMITLSILKSSCGSGTIRKSLHAPSFKLYASKEIPVNTLATRKKLLQKLKSWQKIQTAARYLVEISTSFWNSPEGCVTILMEYMAGNSLARLCENIGAIPEKVLRGISKRILTGLGYYHKKVGPHGCINMSHVLFDREGKCKLGVNLSSKILGKEEDEDSHANDLEEDINSFGNTLISASLGCNDWITEFPTHECCLVHSALAIAEIPYLARLSKDFRDFLCKATRSSGRASINELLSHPWITSEETIGADLSITELLSLSINEGKDFSINIDTQVKILVQSIQVVLTGRNDCKPTNSAALKELAFELDLKPQILYEKIAEIF